MNEIARNEDLRLSAVAKRFEKLAQTPGPKAGKLCEAILSTVEAGYWRPGDRLPSEQDLARIFPISLGTIQSALRQLAQQGVLVRRRGDGSRFVDVSDTGKTDWHVRFLADDHKTLLPIEFDALTIEEIADPGGWSDFLGPAPGYVRITRVLSVGDEFKVFNQFYLDGRRFRPLIDLTPSKLNNLTLRHVLHDRFNAPTLGTSQNIRFAEINDPTATLIGVPQGTTGIAIEVFAYSYRDEPISYQEFLVPPNRRTINIPTT